MIRRQWLAALMVLSVGLVVGCSSSSTTSKPVTPTGGSTPKADEGKSKANVSGVENPPPP